MQPSGPRLLMKHPRRRTALPVEVNWDGEDEAEEAADEVEEQAEY